MLAKAIVLIPRSANKGTEIQMDVLPLVTCKDCKHFDKSFSYCATMGYCDISNIRHEDDWFCADGEEKDGDGNG